MPKGDGTGPLGLGSGTGRGKGWCRRPGFPSVNPGPLRIGLFSLVIVAAALLRAIVSYKALAGPLSRLLLKGKRRSDHNNTIVNADYTILDEEIADHDTGEKKVLPDKGGERIGEVNKKKIGM